MTLKQALTATTCVAVICDALLHPFYPQYFAQVFGVTRPEYVSMYIAASSGIVMLAFPVWAQLTRGRDVLSVLLVTQLASALLCIGCYATRSLYVFIALSLAMLAMKASYLLIYPHVLQSEDPEQHHGTIGWLAFMVHFGSLSAALLSGALLDQLPARWLFVVMAGGDLLQCLLVLAVRSPQLPAAETAADAPPAPLALSRVLRMGLIMFLVYFSAHLSDPFFSTYWQAISGRSSALQSGVVFAIPAVAALCAIALGERQGRTRTGSVTLALACGTGGALLQLAPSLPLLLAGRVIFGWALFVVMVRLDLLLFQQSEESQYAVDFSRIHLFQSAGALCASLAAGSLVGALGLSAPLWATGLGLTVCLALGSWLLPEARARQPLSLEGRAP